MLSPRISGKERRSLWQKPNTFTVDDALAKMHEAASGAGR
jgi:hypothetical protein